MTREQTNDLIESLAEDIRNIYRIETPIRDMDAVVYALGGKIRITRDHPPVSLVRDGDSFEIILPHPMDGAEKRFATAQYLGHLFLHMGYLTCPELWEKQDVYRGGLEKTFQANRFARAFLMPKEEYRETMEKYSEGAEVHTAKIAECFGVSMVDASMRGKELGLFR